MSTFSVRLPESLHKKIKKIAKKGFKIGTNRIKYIGN